MTAQALTHLFVFLLIILTLILQQVLINRLVVSLLLNLCNLLFLTVQNVELNFLFLFINQISPCFKYVISVVMFLRLGDILVWM